MRPEKYLLSLQKFGIKLGLERITAILESLGNPQYNFKSIHIAGTNGKGSTAAMTASILQAAGYKVGLFTSPHLLDVRERVKVNGKDISKKEFADGLKRVRRLKKRSLGSPTYFEALTALAFCYFAKKKVDYAVIEVGMGGRFDSTNVITPEVSVITNIDYDHTHYLGKTLSKIAFEKAGIIKPGVPVVTGEHKKEPLRAMKRVAKKNSSLLIQIEKQSSIRRQNAACAVAAVRLARIKVARKAVKQGLQKVNWPGRFQLISNSQFPLPIILDGAHNFAGIRALKVMIKEKNINGPYVLVVGMQNYKDVAKMVRELSSLARCVIVTQSSHHLAMKAESLRRYFRKYFDQVMIEKQPQQALKKAGQIDGVKSIIVCGSLFLVGDILQFA